MKITKSKLQQIIKEEIAVLTKGAIEDEVMDVLSDEGGAAGPEPIQKALSDLENDDISLPEEPIEDIIGDVPGVKRHKDGDFIDTTKLEGKKVKITKKQLRRIIRETISERIDVVNRKSGEVMVFGREGKEAAPEAAWPELVSRLKLQPEDIGPDNAGDQSFLLSNQDFDKLEQEVIGKQDRRFNKKRAATAMADRERLDIDNLLQRLRYWAEDTAKGYMEDTGGDVDLQDVAYDLADAWEFEFEKDEQEELMWHFDGDLNDLKIYAAESMG